MRLNAKKLSGRKPESLSGEMNVTSYTKSTMQIVWISQYVVSLTNEHGTYLIHSGWLDIQSSIDHYHHTKTIMSNRRTQARKAIAA